MFGLFNRGGKKEQPKHHKNGYKDNEPSAIQKMKKAIAEGVGFAPDSVVGDFPVMDESAMTDEEYAEAIDKLFPVRLTDFYKAVKDGVDPFPIKTDMVDMSVPTMDDVTGGKGEGESSGKPSVLPRNISGTVPGAMPRSSKRCYPPRQGYHAGLEGGGFAMLPDPLLRFPINPRVLKHFQSRIWITYTGCAIIATHEFVNRACMIPAEDAIAHGYKVVCSSSKHEHDQEHDAAEAEFLTEIKKAADKMGLNEACIKLNYKKKVFGVGVAIPWVEFRDDYRSPSDKSGATLYSYADPYDPKAIKPGSFKGFAVVDPHWLTYQWDKLSRTDPSYPYFLTPTWIKVGDKRIHRSWAIRCINSELPDIFKPVYLYGGLSLTQMIYERVWAADKLANEAPLLAMTKRLLIADGNLEQLQSDPARTNKFFNAINFFRDNFSIFVKKPSSNVTQLDTNLSELTPLTMSQYQLVAAIAQIPVTKLLKNVPSGLQATGQYEWDDYAQSLKAIQNNDYTPLCKMFYELYCASNYPDKNDIRLDIEWNPIDVPKESEVAQMSSQTAQYVAHLINTGLIDIAEGRAMLRKTNLPAFQTIPTDIPEILKKIEEAKDPSAQQGGGMPGMPGMEGMMGGANAGQGEEQPPPELPPEVQKNDEVFKDVMRKFLKKTGQETPENENGNIQKGVEHNPSVVEGQNKTQLNPQAGA
ncbi:MAG: DUF1073 domain-containing protein [Prevotella sp.]|nr:DUF1073 domain-containing protein [Prevotella sp.]